MAPEGKTNHTDLSVVVCGSAGQGLNTLASQLVRAVRGTGLNVFSTKEYMSRVRGGANSMQVRMSSARIAAPTERVDLMVVLSPEAGERYAGSAAASTLVVADKGCLADALKQSSPNAVELPLTEAAREVGRGAYQSQVALGFIAGLTGIAPDALDQVVRAGAGKKGEEATKAAVRATEVGGEMAAGLAKEVSWPGASKAQKGGVAPGAELLANGAEAVALGAIAGGCDFIAAYPMSPSTGVLTFLARNAERFGIVVEQCEDEIAGVNMALGAWYAGSRALASTSGGGFALMEEGVSLAAMIESPLVLHVAQRPGPATGLPTRTEQGDLDLVLHSGHGEFPRVVLAPGSVEEAFYLTHRAFNIAARLQTQVFILTDQYLIDSTTNIPAFDLTGLDVEHGIVETEAGYKRYALTDTGLSPRGVPGHGEGLVMVDSDEHDEDGRITEDMGMRVAMVDKRLARLEMIRAEVVEPVLIGDPDAETVVLGWGSTFEIAREALAAIDRPEILYVHNPQPWPIHPRTVELAAGAKKLAVLEGNATGQFARLVAGEAGRVADELILRYDGLQFTVEQIAERLGGL